MNANPNGISTAGPAAMQADQDQVSFNGRRAAAQGNIETARGTFGIFSIGRESWRARIGKLTRSMAMLGAGEALAWGSSFVLFAYVSRRYGVALLGVLALAQTAATYATMATDQGLRLIGARLVARDPTSTKAILRPLMAKRLLLGAGSVLLGSVYALRGPMPAAARPFVLGFVFAVIPYALTLDWIAWGLHRMGWLGAQRGFVKIVFAAGAILGMHFSGAPFWPLVLSNFAAAGAGAILFWILWRAAWGLKLSPPAGSVSPDACRQLMWGSVFSLGAATMFNLLFNNADTLILAGMTSASEVGRYNAAYKLIFIVFGSYYLLTQSLYPGLSRMQGGAHARKLMAFSLVVVGALGTCLGLALAVWAPRILRLLYGSDLGAIDLLRILCLAIPIEFCVALLGTVLVSRGFHGLVLGCTASAAAFNISLNFYLIPTGKAEGAAWATVLSYLFLLALVLATFLAKPVLGEDHLTERTPVVSL